MVKTSLATLLLLQFPRFSSLRIFTQKENKSLPKRNRVQTLQSKPLPKKKPSLFNPCMEEDNSKKRPLDLDWEVVLDKNDAEPPALVIVKTTMEPPKPSPSITDHSQKEDHASMTDPELEEAIKRHRAHIVKLGPTLPDKGEKLRLAVKGLEDERERRKLQRPVMVRFVLFLFFLVKSSDFISTLFGCREKGGIFEMLVLFEALLFL